MANKTVQGCVVSIPATYFDGRSNEKWSEQQFGDSWNTTTCSGIVQRVLHCGQWCRVKWDIDGAIARVAVRDLNVDKWPHVSSSSEMDVSDEEESSELHEVGSEHRESRQGQTLPRDDLPISSDSENSSSIEESSSSESVPSDDEANDDEANDPRNGCGRKVRLCCTFVAAIFIVSL